MRLGQAPRRSRWVIPVAVLLPAGVAAVLALGVPGEHGCGGPMPSDTVLPCEALDNPLLGRAPRAARHVVFLNRGGATLEPGSDDPVRGLSSVLSLRKVGRLEIPAAPFDDAAWNAVVTCVRQRFARYDVDFVTERPALPGYQMTVFGGTGAELGFDDQVGGTAPIDLDRCSDIRQAVSFVFSTRLGADPLENCLVAAQEIAHAFSVDHAMLAEDAMSYLDSTTPKRFMDVEAPCGEFEERACACGRGTQNSHRLLLEHVGPAHARGDNEAPTLEVRWEASRQDSARVVARAQDALGVSEVRIGIRMPGGTVVSSACGDGLVACTQRYETWTFNVPELPDGATLQVTAVDGSGNLVSTGPALVDRARLADGGGDLSTVMNVRAVRVGGGILAAPAVRVPDGARDVALRWTGTDGTEHSAELCSSAGARAVPVLLGSEPGARHLVVEWTAADGTRVQSLPEAVTLER